MEDELNKVIGEQAVEETAAPSEEVQEAPQEAKDEELAKKEEQLSNLNKAITEAQGQLKAARKEKASVKVEEEELPRIDFQDPSAKAWDKHVADKVSPMQQELEKEKEEVRTFALRKFLSEHPSLSKNQDKLKEVVATYERIRTASERTQEGVLVDLDKAYAAVHHEELMAASRRARVDEAEASSFAADIAISRGATSYQAPREPSAKLSADDKAILSKWGMTETEWAVAKKKYG